MILDSINNRLQTTLISHGKIHLHFQAIDVEKIVSRVVNSYQLRAFEKLQRISLEVHSTGYFWGDELRFAKILDQLISNAIKFSPSHTHINVAIRCDAAHVYISVEDQGPGLSSYDQEFLFKKFIPLSARPTGGESSLGLGLSLAKQLVEIQAGHIGVVSAGEGTGATFTVTFPLFQISSQAKSA